MLRELRCLEREIHHSKWATLKLILQEFYMYNCEVWVCIHAVYLHHLPQLLRQLGLPEDIMAPQLQHCAVSAIILLLPGCLALGAHLASPLADRALQAAGAPLNDASCACAHAAGRRRHAA